MAARERILEFLRTLSRRHRVFGVLHRLATHALVWAVVLVIVDYLAPTLLPPTSAVAGVALLAVAIAGCLRLRPRLGVADRELRLQDRLLTYAGLVGAGVDAARAPMQAWLERDLDGRLQALPPQQAERLWRRPLGRVRYLLPVLLLLLLVRLLAPALPPIRPSGPSPSSSEGGGGAGGEAEPPQAGSEQPQQQPPPPEPQPAPPPPEPEPGPPQTLPPKPLIELEREQKFVVPDFIGAGEGRRSLAHVAELGAGESPPPAGGAEQEARPPDAQADFERAREGALRARHVPPNERDFVKRYFDALVRQGK